MLAPKRRGKTNTFTVVSRRDAMSRVARLFTQPLRGGKGLVTYDASIRPLVQAGSTWVTFTIDDVK